MYYWISFRCTNNCCLLIVLEILCCINNVFVLRVLDSRVLECSSNHHDSQYNLSWQQRLCSECLFILCYHVRHSLYCLAWIIWEHLLCQLISRKIRLHSICFCLLLISRICSILCIGRQIIYSIKKKRRWRKGIMKELNWLSS